MNPPLPSSLRAPAVGRRALVTVSFLVAVSAAVSPSAKEASQTPEDFFELETLGPGIYAAVVVPRPPTYVFASSLVVTSEEGVLVVDTQQSPEAARALITLVRRLTDAPVRYVVNTHWHGDHVYGNEAYRDVFPGVVFVGHPTTRADVLERGSAHLAEELVSLPQSIREREEALASGELTAEERARLQYSRDARTRYLAELRDLRLVPPNLTVADRLTMHVGAIAVEVRHLGPAHTRGDLVVYLPDARVLAAGDLVENAFPYFGDAYPAGWAAALESIGALDVSILLPSHGPVLRDRDLLDTETRLLRLLVDEVGRAVAAGSDLERAQAETLATLEPFRSRFGADGFDGAVKAAVERAFREARGELSLSP